MLQNRFYPNFQHQKKTTTVEKSYYTEDWTVHMLQLHRLPLLPVTGEEPHNGERAKSLFAKI